MFKQKFTAYTSGNGKTCKYRIVRVKTGMFGTSERTIEFCDEEFPDSQAAGYAGTMRALTLEREKLERRLSKINREIRILEEKRKA